MSYVGKWVEFVIETLEQEKINQVDSRDLTIDVPRHGNCVNDDKRSSLEDTGKDAGWCVVRNGCKASTNGGKSGLDLVRRCRT